MDIRISDNKEQSRCFVCDASVRGRYYGLATCRTQISQAKVIEKLGELVGERYMVVISEDDVICRDCAILVNTLDRLETETRNIRNHILRFLERKYFLEDGELRGNSDRPKPCQPPQITRSNAKEIIGYRAKRNEIYLETYSKDKKTRKRSHWLRCDKCKYTTHLDSFMMHHSRDHIGRKVSCDKCGLCFIGNKEETMHYCANAYKSDTKENEIDNINVIAKTDLLDTSMPAEKTMPSASLPTQTLQPIISLASNDHICIPSTLAANDPAVFKQSMYILQPINAVDIDNSRNIAVRSIAVEETGEKSGNVSRGQTLTLMEDGSLEMTEAACWKET